MRDVARVITAPREDQARVWRQVRAGDAWTGGPAVSLAIAKRKGANAVVVSHAVLHYLNRLSDLLFVAGRRANANGAEDVKWVPGLTR